VLHAAIIGLKINVTHRCWVKDLCGMGAASLKLFNINDTHGVSCLVSYSPEYAPCSRMYNAI
jgi:hypothetical protein